MEVDLFVAAVSADASGLSKLLKIQREGGGLDVVMAEQVREIAMQGLVSAVASRAIWH